MAAIRIHRLNLEVLSPHIGCCNQPTPPTPGTTSRSITVIMQATGIVECRLTNVPRPRVRIGANSRVVGRLTNA
jgi:hypothetical protein